jgi:hypothetical protein
MQPRVQREISAHSIGPSQRHSISNSRGLWTPQVSPSDADASRMINGMRSPANSDNALTHQAVSISEIVCTSVGAGQGRVAPDIAPKMRRPSALWSHRIVCRVVELPARYTDQLWAGSKLGMWYITRSGIARCRVSGTSYGRRMATPPAWRHRSHVSVVTCLLCTTRRPDECHGSEGGQLVSC